MSNRRDRPAGLSNCNSDRVLPGQGILDLPALLGRLETLGYEGYFAIEMFSEEMWAMPAREAAQLMHDRPL